MPTVVPRSLGETGKECAGSRGVRGALRMPLYAQREGFPGKLYPFQGAVVCPSAGLKGLAGFDQSLMMKGGDLEG